ncbi:hypothetical protein HS088_TW05G00671 [Tripterygium wilfordii]|uniref:Uncharacterized protein n=1 Tax=Tripterygium wilfordii TaxID=458696 RepID=A0A7J7DNJ5_TRIWF|nr:hypothetical protein HS088_TW05G00671 [Tripterygium wilfordii]
MADDESSAVNILWHDTAKSSLCVCLTMSFRFSWSMDYLNVLQAPAFGQANLLAILECCHDLSCMYVLMMNKFLCFDTAIVSSPVLENGDHW